MTAELMHYAFHTVDDSTFIKRKSPIQALWLIMKKIRMNSKMVILYFGDLFTYA